MKAARKSIVDRPGVCRVCGCTERNPCVIQVIGGIGTEICSWFDAQRTLCTNPQCIGRFPLADLITMGACGIGAFSMKRRF